MRGRSPPPAGSRYRPNRRDRSEALPCTRRAIPAMPRVPAPPRPRCGDAPKTRGATRRQRRRTRPLLRSSKWLCRAKYIPGARLPAVPHRPIRFNREDFRPAVPGQGEGRDAGGRPGAAAGLRGAEVAIRCSLHDPRLVAQGHHQPISPSARHDRIGPRAPRLAMPAPTDERGVRRDPPRAGSFRVAHRRWRRAPDNPATAR